MNIQKRIRNISCYISAIILLFATITVDANATVPPHATEELESQGNVEYIDGDTKIKFCADDFSKMETYVNNLDLLVDIPNEPITVSDWLEKTSHGTIEYIDTENHIKLTAKDFDILANKTTRIEEKLKNIEDNIGINRFLIPQSYAGIVVLNPNSTIKSTSLPQNKNGEFFNGLLAQKITVDCSDATVIANNMPLGKKAYNSEGNLITGNGSDINAAYTQGFIDGQTNVIGNVSITYTYHHHEGTPGVVGGCYQEEQYITGYEKQTITVPNRLSSVDDNGTVYAICPGCGAHASKTWSTGEAAPIHCWSTVYVDDPSRPIYGTRIVLKCGKTTNTVESATIYYN